MNQRANWTVPVQPATVGLSLRQISGNIPFVCVVSAMVPATSSLVCANHNPMSTQLFLCAKTFYFMYGEQKPKLLIKIKRDSIVTLKKVLQILLRGSQISKLSPLNGFYRTYYNMLSCICSNKLFRHKHCHTVKPVLSKHPQGTSCNHS